MDMELAWLLPAIPAVLFVVIALFGRLLPRHGDWLAILGMGTVTVLSALMISDFQRGNIAVWSLEWMRISDGTRVVELIEISTYVDSITVVMLSPMMPATSQGRSGDNTRSLVRMAGFMVGVKPRFSVISSSSNSRYFLVPASSVLFFLMADLLFQHE